MKLHQVHEVHSVYKYLLLGLMIRARIKFHSLLWSFSQTTFVSANLLAEFNLQFCLSHSCSVCYLQCWTRDSGVDLKLLWKTCLPVLLNLMTDQSVLRLDELRLKLHGFNICFDSSFTHFWLLTTGIRSESTVFWEDRVWSLILLSHLLSL